MNTSINGSTLTLSPTMMANGTLSGDDEVVVVVQKSNFRFFLWILAGFSTISCFVVSSLLIRKHLIHYTRPREQRKIVGILWLAPIFAFDSFISLSFTDLTPTMDLLKEIYEGYSVYLFFSLLVEYLGGEARAVELIKQRLEPLYRPWPMRLFCKGPLTDDADAFLWGCKWGVMQFVVVRPTMAMISAILFLAGKYQKGDFSLDKGYVYIELINNFSVSYAVYCLVLFYMAMKRPLAAHNPLPKFIAIKAVVFLSFWQGIVLALLARFQVIQEAGSWTSENVTTGVHDTLICFEMLLAAFYHKIAFPWEIYDRGRAGSIASAGLEENFAISDARRDFALILPKNIFRSSPIASKVIHPGSSRGDTEVEAQIIEPHALSVSSSGATLHASSQSTIALNKSGARDVIMEGEQPLLRDED